MTGYDGFPFFISVVIPTLFLSYRFNTGTLRFAFQILVCVVFSLRNTLMHTHLSARLEKYEKYEM